MSVYKNFWIIKTSLVGLLICFFLLMANCTATFKYRQKPADLLFEERFSSKSLNDMVWKKTHQNDFQEATVDLIEQRLRLRAATIGTDDQTVKFFGVRTVKPIINFSQPIEISFELDWNNQANGCYMTAGIYLCPTPNDKNPRDEKDWLKFEYIGVPPGKNARGEIWRRVRGIKSWIYNEGWPREQRIGRKISLQQIRLLVDEKSLKVIENDKLLYEISTHELGFNKAYLYLQMSSHSNYPPREIFFDNIVIKSR